MKSLAPTLATAGLLALATFAPAPQAAAHADEAEEDHHEENADGGEAAMQEEESHGEEGHGEEGHGEEGHGEEGHGEEGHGEPGHHDLETMREMHREHEHEHDFAAIDRLEPEERQRLFTVMREVGLALPPMDPERGRTLFLEKGCVACHSVNGVGGDIGPSLNAEDMPEPMNAFEFAARMWRGAPAMAELQDSLLGDVITLDGRELANLIAFAHDEEAQTKLSADQIPERYRKIAAGE